MLPKLVELDDIRGDLHSHTTWSDGRASLDEMVARAKGLGRTYLAVCDHARRLRQVGCGGGRGCAVDSRGEWCYKNRRGVIKIACRKHVLTPD